MRITQVDPHLRSLYNQPERRNWYPFVINGFDDEIEQIDEWVSDNMDASTVHSHTVFGGRQNKREKFNLQLAFRSENDAVAFRLRWAGDDHANPR